MAAPTERKESTLSDLVLGWGHITLPVTDMARALRFYTEVLGFEQVGRKLTPEEIERAKAAGTIRAPHLSVRPPNGPRLDLFEVPYQRAQLADDHPHFAFRVSGEHMDSCGEALRRAGVPFDGPSRRGPPGGASLYFLDPFGNHLEFNCDSGYDGQVEDRPPIWQQSLVYTWP